MTLAIGETEFEVEDLKASLLAACAKLPTGTAERTLLAMKQNAYHWHRVIPGWIDKHESEKENEVAP